MHHLKTKIAPTGVFNKTTYTIDQVRGTLSHLRTHLQNFMNEAGVPGGQGHYQQVEAFIRRFASSGPQTEYPVASSPEVIERMRQMVLRSHGCSFSRSFRKL